MSTATTSQDQEIMDILQEVWLQEPSASTVGQTTATPPASPQIPIDFSQISIMQEPSLLLIIAVIIEMILPYMSKMKISGLENTFKHLGCKVNRPHDGVGQHALAGILLPLLILAIVFLPFSFIEYFTNSDGIISLLLLCVLLELKYPQNQSLIIYDTLTKNMKHQAKHVLKTMVLRDTEMLSPMGIAKATAESAILRITSGYLAIMFWYMCAGIEAALLMQLLNVMNHAFNAKLSRNQPFGRAVFIAQQFMLIPVAIVLQFLLLFSRNPLRHLIKGWEGLQKYPAPISGAILGAVGGALDLSLGGPRYYAGQIVRLPRIGGTQVANPESILYAMRKIRMSSLIFLVIAIFLDINFV